MDDFFLRLMLAGLGLSLITSPMGCFLVWRRLSFFSDALSHSVLLGVALSLILHIDVNLGIVAICLVTALLLSTISTKSTLPADTGLSIISYGSLSLGVILVSKFSPVRIDPSSYLLGDILTIQAVDLYWIYGCVIGVWGFIGVYWQPLLLLTLHQDLAHAEGIPTKKLNLGFLILLAIIVAVSLKLIGALLMPALLVIPPATAAFSSKTPEEMVVKTLILTILSMFIGGWLSFYSNVPTGAAVVCFSLLLFLISILFGKKKCR
ncbi:MAG: metal ABC transporter permease [Alphaproteobacteria bacterium]|nr:metal ABC transporter permease [Alphaproteobacteria bacterium]